MIKSFADSRTAALFLGKAVKGVPANVRDRARAKLRMIDAAVNITDLRIPPGNRLETLKGSRAGQQSIRVNNQWRLCFVWRQDDAFDVEFCDYH